VSKGTELRLDPDGVDLIFGLPHQRPNLYAFHPQPDHVIKLWQTFLENVNPLTKILHVPTFHKVILDTSADLQKVSRSTEALMFAIYSCTVVSMSDDECKESIGEPKARLLVRWRCACQQALMSAGLLHSSDLVVLQAFVLYLVCIRLVSDFPVRSGAGAPLSARCSAARLSRPFSQRVSAGAAPSLV
jgi:hypothetical protein